MSPTPPPSLTWSTSPPSSPPPPETPPRPSRAALAYSLTPLHTSPSPSPSRTPPPPPPPVLDEKGSCYTYLPTIREEPLPHSSSAKFLLSANFRDKAKSPSALRHHPFSSIGTTVSSFKMGPSPINTTMSSAIPRMSTDEESAPLLDVSPDNYPAPGGYPASPPAGAGPGLSADTIKPPPIPGKFPQQQHHHQSRIPPFLAQGLSFVAGPTDNNNTDTATEETKRRTFLRARLSIVLLLRLLLLIFTLAGLIGTLVSRGWWALIDIRRMYIFLLAWHGAFVLLAALRRLGEMRQAGNLKFSVTVTFGQGPGREWRIGGPRNLVSVSGAGGMRSGAGMGMQVGGTGRNGARVRVGALVKALMWVAELAIFVATLVLAIKVDNRWHHTGLGYKGHWPVMGLQAGVMCFMPLGLGLDLGLTAEGWLKDVLDRVLPSFM